VPSWLITLINRRLNVYSAEVKNFIKVIIINELQKRAKAEKDGLTE
jgi:hypothetical protein